jgi:predicted Zn-ribbon and HTH transcriptional regulator
VLIPELERRYNEPYEVAKRARKDVAKRARVAAVALSSEQRAATRRAGAIERARAADERRINSALRTRRQTVGRQILKRVLVHYSGGCCEKCGYREFQSVLEFHHRDPSEKSGQISKMVSALSTCADFGLRFREVMTECDKCLLLCPTCHRVEHHYERMKPGSLVLSMLPTQDQLSHLGLRRSDFKTLG